VSFRGEDQRAVAIRPWRRQLRLFGHDASMSRIRMFLAECLHRIEVFGQKGRARFVSLGSDHRFVHADQRA
jgi:hypothetical protein